MSGTAVDDAGAVVTGGGVVAFGCGVGVAGGGVVGTFVTGALLGVLVTGTLVEGVVTEARLTDVGATRVGIALARALVVTTLPSPPGSAYFPSADADTALASPTAHAMATAADAR